MIVYQVGSISYCGQSSCYVGYSISMDANMVVSNINKSQEYGWQYACDWCS